MAAPRVCHVDDLSPGSTDGVEVAVVIDVIRAFTVAPWCLARGAAALLLAPDLATAVRARETRYPDALLLKDGEPDDRFALPNSPGRIALEDLRGRTVVQRTGNGTRGAHAVGHVPAVLLASFVTAAATARVIAPFPPERVLLVPTEGDEDVALADHLLALLAADGGADGPGVDPEPSLDRVRRSDAAQECRDRGDDPAYPGHHPDDLRRCLQIDAFDHALRARPDGELLAVTAC